MVVGIILRGRRKSDDIYSVIELDNHDSVKGCESGIGVSVPRIPVFLPRHQHSSSWEAKYGVTPMEMDGSGRYDWPQRPSLSCRLCVSRIFNMR